MATGKCTNCGKITTSLAYKLCKSCASEKSVCGKCMKPLKVKTYLCTDCSNLNVPMKRNNDLS